MRIKRRDNLAYALLISGSEARFCRESKLLAKFLKQQPCISKVRTLSMHDAGDKLNYLKFGKIVLDALTWSPEPFLLAFNGHGNMDGWSLNKQLGEIDSYDLKNALWHRYPYPTLILNDCCMSNKLALILNESALAATPIGVIAACAARSITTDGLTRNVVKQWREKKAFDPRRSTHQTFDEALKPKVRSNYKRDHKRHVWEKLHQGVGARRWGAVLDHHFFSI